MNQSARKKQDSHSEEFQSLAMNVARNMLEARDVAHLPKGPLPRDFKIKIQETYLATLTAAQKRLKDLEETSPAQAEIIMIQDYERSRFSMRAHDQAMQERNASAKRLLKEADAWDALNIHESIKQQIKSELIQIQSGGDATFGTLEPLKLSMTGKEYLEQSIQAQKIYINGLKKNIEDEKRRIQYANEWLEKLKSSLGIS